MKNSTNSSLCNVLTYDTEKYQLKVKIESYERIKKRLKNPLLVGIVIFILSFINYIIFDMVIFVPIATLEYLILGMTLEIIIEKKILSTMEEFKSKYKTVIIK
ncbi:MAG: hypothetical protein VZS44_08795 [Bacilli bacterium]|nr:hypothetical protein [Bacilli bacterium]